MLPVKIPILLFTKSDVCFGFTLFVLENPIFLFEMLCVCYFILEIRIFLFKIMSHFHQFPINSILFVKIQRKKKKVTKIIGNFASFERNKLKKLSFSQNSNPKNYYRSKSRSTFAIYFFAI